MPAHLLCNLVGRLLVSTVLVYKPFVTAGKGQSSPWQALKTKCILESKAGTSDEAIVSVYRSGGYVGPQ